MESGVVIKRVYFADWRYSEDLDFTAPTLMKRSLMVYRPPALARRNGCLPFVCETVSAGGSILARKWRCLSRFLRRWMADFEQIANAARSISRNLWASASLLASCFPSAYPNKKAAFFVGSSPSILALRPRLFVILCEREH